MKIDTQTPPTEPPPNAAQYDLAADHAALFRALAFALPGMREDAIDRAVEAVCEELGLSLHPTTALPGGEFKVARVTAGKGLWLHAGMNGELLARLEPGIEVRTGKDREGWRQVIVRGWCRGDGLAE